MASHDSSAENWISLEEHEGWLGPKHFVAWGEKSLSCWYGRESVADLGNHTLKFLKRNAHHARFAGANPSLEDCKQVCPICLLKPQRFVDAIEFKSQNDLFCCIFAISLLKFLLRNGIV